jgi:L-lactate utilization protein LutC
MSVLHSSSRDGRETIIARIREASKASGLHTPAPMPPNEGRDGLPEASPDRAVRASAFARRMEELRVSFVFCDTLEDAADGVAMMAQSSGWNTIASHEGSLLKNVNGRMNGKIVLPGADKAKLGACEAGIVECLAMDAQTGAILIAGATGVMEFTATSPTLVIIGTADRIAGSLDDAFSMAKSAGGGKLPAGLSIITGASITAAIERKPIQRGHGPLKLVVYLALSES